jgi:uncharacterized C2H2 Zn-finger protein
VSAEKLWRCPVCGRLLSKPNQWHSHFNTSIDAHFEGKAELKAFFDDLVARLEELGNVRVDAVKSSINLIAKHHFGGVTVLKDSMRLGFILPHSIDNPRVIKTEVLGPNKFAYFVKLSTINDIDSQLMQWLKEAYERAS